MNFISFLKKKEKYIVKYIFTQIAIYQLLLLNLKYL